MAEKLQWGYALSAVIFGALIGVAALAYYLFKADVVLVFWIAYVLTRPFGASIGDLLSQPASTGGMGFGAERVSVVFLAIIVALVVLLTVRARLRSNDVEQ